MPLPPAIRRFVEDAGNLTQSFGLGRVLGQLYALLYFSRSPCNLGDIQQALGVSKGCASMTARQLEQWGAVRKVWVKGDRRDYYEANEWIGQIIRNVLTDTIGKRLAQSNGSLDLDEDVSFGTSEDDDFVRSRIENLLQFRVRAQKLWENPVVKRLLR